MRPQDKTIADHWRSLAHTSWDWRKAASQAGGQTDYRPGEAGGFFATCSEFPGRRVYLKPLKLESDKYRAAREKIAADLAYDLGLCVPPVLLATRQDALGAEETNVCVSLVLYARQWSWQQIRQLINAGAQDEITQLASASLADAAALAHVFDTWVDQYDHNDHPHNIVFGYTPEMPDKEHAFVFLDYSFSMGLDGRWRNNGYMQINPAGFPLLMKQAITEDALEEAISRIQGYPEQKINQIVNKIPESHLDVTDRELIVGGLCYRKDRIRGSLLPVPASA